MEREEYISRAKQKIIESYSEYDVLKLAYIYISDKKEGIREYYKLFYPETLHDTKEPKKLLKKLEQRLKTELGYKTEYSETFKKIILGKDEAQAHSIMKELARKIAPNTSAIIGEKVTTELLIRTNGLRNLSRLTSAKIQVLGAEKALHAHKLGADSPKHGIIYQLVRDQDYPGRRARHIANIIAQSSKIDYFSRKINKDFCKKHSRSPMMKTHDVA